MNQKQFEEMLREMANEHGVTVEELRSDMEIAMNAAKNNPDPKAQAKWAAIPCKGKSPTLAEFIIHAADTISREMEDGGAE